MGPGRLALLGGLLLGLGALAGCGSYALAGRVVEGPEPAIRLVGSGDPAPDRRGVEGARVEAILDPATLAPEEVGGAVTDAQGRFRIPVKALGAGFLEYELGMHVRAKGFQTLWQTLPMPGRGRRLLVVVTPGQPGDAGPPPDIVEETLEMAQ